MASLLAYRYHNVAVRALYKAAAVWLGLFSFLFVAAVASWMIFAIPTMANVPIHFHRMVEILLASAAAVGIYGVFNAGWTRITRITVRLANLPEAWRGRTRALISDVHLGHVRNGNFLRRISQRFLSEEPARHLHRRRLIRRHRDRCRHAAAPLQNLTAPYGVYFVAGNHEQFGDDSKYLQRGGSRWRARAPQRKS